MKKIITIITIMVMLMVTILVGSPVKDNVEIVKCLLVLVATLYIIIKLKKKTPIITNRMDIFVILLMFSCYMPLIFGTYASLEDTIISILTYTSLVAIYFVGKEIASDKKSIKWIRNIQIVSGIIFLIFGIDNLTSNIFSGMLNKLGVLQYMNQEERLISNLGYANSIGIIMASMYLISVNTFVTEKNRFIRIILGSTSFLFLSGLLLTESKGNMLFLGIIYIVYFFLNKKAKYKSKIIVITIVSIITSYIFYVLFSKVKENELIIWLSLILLYLITLAILTFSKKIIKFIQKHIYKIDIKKTIIILIIIMLIIIILFFILLQFTSPLILSKEETTTARMTIRKIKPNSTYNISFDIEAKGNEENNAYEISIDEENKYDQIISEHKIYIGNYKGTKEINIYTDEATKRLTIRYNKLDDSKGELIIKKLIINKKEIPVNYKFVPMELVGNIESMTLENKNFWERGVFIIDGIKLASKNLITGIGGNGWEHLYQLFQSYNYSARYSHCYLITLLIENGIIGVIAFLGLIFYIIKNLYKNKKYNIVGLIVLLILLHSMMDFDMEFYCINIIVFLGLGIISNYETNKIKNIKMNNLLSIILIIIFILSGMESGKNIYVESKLEEGNVEIENLEKILPYSLEIKNRKLEYLNKCNNLDEKAKTLNDILKIEKYYDNITWYKEMASIGIEKIKCKEEEKGINYLNQAIKEIKNKKFIPRLNLDSYKYACSNIEQICKELEKTGAKKDIIEENYKLIIDLVEESKENVSDYEITRKSKLEYLENSKILEEYEKNAQEYIIQNK